MIKQFFLTRSLQSKFLFLLLPSLFVITFFYSSIIFRQQNNVAYHFSLSSVNIDVKETALAISMMDRTKKIYNQAHAITSIIHYTLDKNPILSCIKTLIPHKKDFIITSYFNKKNSENLPCSPASYPTFYRYTIPHSRGIIEVYIRNHIPQELPYYFFKQEFLLEFFIFLSIIFCTAFAFHTVINNPLRKITQRLLQFKKENIYRPLSYKNQDEIGTLIQAYNNKLSIEKKLYSTIEEQNLLLECLIGTIPLPMVFFEENFHIRYYNKPFFQFFDAIIPTDLLNTLSIDYFLHEDLINKLIHDIHTTEEISPLKTTITLNDNASHEVILYMGRVQTNEHQGYILLIEDITQIKTYEQSLEKIKTETEEKNKDLEKTKKLLIKSEKMALLGNMIATITHEINTPLGSSVTLISTAEDNSKSLAEKIEKKEHSEEDIKGYIDDITYISTLITRNLENIDYLLQNFRSVSIDQITTRRRCFNLKETIIQTIETLSHHNKQVPHKLILHCPENIVVDSYPGPFSQVISNLYVNSLIHGLSHIQNGYISISGYLASEKELVLKVEDNGKGIPKDIVQNIFQPFFTTNTSSGGTGLGLHIVHDIVTKTLGGNIQVEHPNKGISFIIHIPTNAPTLPIS